MVMEKVEVSDVDLVCVYLLIMYQKMKIILRFAGETAFYFVSTQIE